MGPLSSFRSFSAVALAAAISPFVFFGLLILMVFGFTAVAVSPLIFAFIAMLMLNRWSRKERQNQIFEARVIREEAPSPYPAEAYTPPVHFDLLLSAKQDIGRIRGAVSAMVDPRIAQQFGKLANEADTILARVMKEPAKLGLARRFFASYLPRSADLAEGMHKLALSTQADDPRRAKLLDVLYRLETAMKEADKAISAPELARLDADIRILDDDLKGVRPSFTQPPETIYERVEAVLKEAQKKKKKD